MNDHAILAALDTEAATHALLTREKGIYEYAMDTYDPACCPACGDPIDYCAGHGAIGDPDLHDVLVAHDDGDHTFCHINGCDDAHDDGSPL